MKLHLITAGLFKSRIHALVLSQTDCVHHCIKDIIFKHFLSIPYVWINLFIYYSIHNFFIWLKNVFVQIEFELLSYWVIQWKYYKQTYTQ